MMQQVKDIIIAGLMICGLTTAQATLLVSENFDYSGTSLSGQADGTGWNSGWSIPDTGDSVSLSSGGTSLTFTGLTGSGSSVTAINENNNSTSLVTTSPSSVAVTAERQLSSQLALNAAGTYYVSMLINKSSGSDADVSFGFQSYGNTEVPRMSWRYTSDNKIRISSGGTQSTMVSDTASLAGTFASGETYLLVMKIDASASSADSFSIKVFSDGDSLTEPTTWDATSTITTSSTLDYFGLIQNSGSGSVSFDRLMIGTEFSDVIPEPASVGLLLTGTVLVCALRRRLK